MASMEIAALVTLMLVLASCGQVSSSSFTARDVQPVGGIVDLRITDPVLSLEKVNFATTGESGNFTLRVENYTPGAEWEYEKFGVLTSGLSSVPSDIVMDFRIRKAWLEAKNADQKTVALNFYHNDSKVWERLTSVKFSEDAEFLHYRALSSPSLTGAFAVTAEPVPVDITFTLHCNANGACEPEKGEDADSCSRDCASAPSYARCAPLATYCSGDSMLTCNDDGSGYSTQACAGGCGDGQCLDTPVATGMAFLGTSPFFIVVIILVSLVAYLFFSLRNIRRRLYSAERLR